MDLLPTSLLLAGSGSLLSLPSPLPRVFAEGLRRRAPRVLLVVGAAPGASCVLALPGSATAGQMGGVRQAAVRRTRAGPGIRRTLYAPGRHLQQSPARHRGRYGSLPLEGLSRPRPAEGHDRLGG